MKIIPNKRAFTCPFLLQSLCCHELYSPKQAPVGYFCTQTIAIVDFLLRVVAVLARSHNPHSKVSRNTSSMHPIPIVRARVDGAPTHGRSLRKLNLENHVMLSTALRRLNELKQINESLFRGCKFSI